MAPLPKRKHSTYRKGKRMAARIKKIKKLVICRHCQQKKIPHYLCSNCNK